jgi:hypothetical protein
MGPTPTSNASSTSAIRPSACPRPLFVVNCQVVLCMY